VGSRSGGVRINKIYSKEIINVHRLAAKKNIAK
jgi:hypothetical protein